MEAIFLAAAVNARLEKKVAVESFLR